MSKYNRSSFAALMFLSSMAVGALGAGTAMAQEQGADTPAWLKLCNQVRGRDITICATAQEVRAETGQFLASVAIRKISNQDQEALVVAVPTGMLLQAGIGLRIDESDPRVLPYSICSPQACLSETEATAEVIDSFKRGGKIAVLTRNQQGEQIQFPLTLVGFTKAYDGEATDPEVLRNQRDQMRQELEEKAKQARERLIRQQQEATSGN